MIPLDRVREMLAAATPGPWSPCASSVIAEGISAFEWEVSVNGRAGFRHADAALIAAAPDLARDVLTLADALATAERERDEARAERNEAESDGIDQCVLLQEEAVDLRAHLATARAALTLAAEREADAVAERDTARSALDGLAAAVRSIGDLIATHGCSCDCDCAHTTGEHISECDPCLACRMSDVVSPLLDDAPAPSMVPAALVREYLAASDRYEAAWAPMLVHDGPPLSDEAVAAAIAGPDAEMGTARAALEAALGRCV